MDSTLVGLFCIIPVTFEPKTPLIVVVPVVVPLLIINPVLFIDAESETDEAPVPESIILPELATSEPPMVRFPPALFSIAPTLLPMDVPIVVGPVPVNVIVPELFMELDPLNAVGTVPELTSKILPVPVMLLCIENIPALLLAIVISWFSVIGPRNPPPDPDVLSVRTPLLPDTVVTALYMIGLPIETSNVAAARH